MASMGTLKKDKKDKKRDRPSVPQALHQGEDLVVDLENTVAVSFRHFPLTARHSSSGRALGRGFKSSSGG